MNKDAKQDLSSFMAILIMTIGCLVVLLVSNVIIIISNPDNVHKTDFIRANDSLPTIIQKANAQAFPWGSKRKVPHYLDVYPDRFVIYSGDDEHVMLQNDLDRDGNAFEQLLDYLHEKKQDEYAVFLMRPGSTVLARRLRRSTTQRGIDIGTELIEGDRKISFETTDEMKYIPESNPLKLEPKMEGIR